MFFRLDSSAQIFLRNTIEQPSVHKAIPGRGKSYSQIICTSVVTHLTILFLETVFPPAKNRAPHIPSHLFKSPIIKLQQEEQT